MRLPVFALLITLAACGGDSGPPADPFIAEWKLDTYNGHTLPAAQSTGTLVSESLILNADHTYTDAQQTQTGPNAFTWSYGDGAWSKTDSVTVALSPGNGFTFEAKLNTRTSLSVEWLGVSSHYHR